MSDEISESVSRMIQEAGFSAAFAFDVHKVMNEVINELRVEIVKLREEIALLRDEIGL